MQAVRRRKGKNALLIYLLLKLFVFFSSSSSWRWVSSWTPCTQDQNIMHVTESVPIRSFCYSCNKLSHRESPLRPIFHLNFPHRIKQRVWFWKTEIEILSSRTQHWQVMRIDNSKAWCETSMVWAETACVITGFGNVSTLICLFIILINYS